MKTFYKIQICYRVDLYFNNEGFLFTNKLIKQRGIKLYFKNHFQSWPNWKYHYSLYIQDGIIEKVMEFKNNCTEREQSERFFKELTFENPCFVGGGIKYTRDARIADELGYIKVSYLCIYFNGAKWEENIMQSWVYVRSKKDAIHLCNYWNSINSNYKYWV